MKFIISLITYLFFNIVFVTNSAASELLEDVQFLLSAEETIDYNDPKLNEILNKYDYDLFKTYKAFIEFDKSDKKTEDISRAINVMPNDLVCLENLKGDSQNEIIDAYLQKLASVHIADDISEIINDNPLDRSSNIKIPLWLVLKYPYVLYHNNGRSSLAVNAKSSLYDLKQFDKFNEELLSIVNSYWDNDQGTIRMDQYAARINYLKMISFAPKLLLTPRDFHPTLPNVTSEEPLKYIEFWSYEGIWNRLKYKKIIQYLDKAILELAEYYSNNYGLKEYASHAQLILEGYIGYLVPGISYDYDQLPFEAQWYDGFKGYYELLEMISPYKDNIAKLKSLSVKLTSKEKGYILFYSILKNLDLDFLEWLIHSGADVNVMPCGETPLMASVRIPHLMQLLINSGADITIRNRFGKNILFYAAQFGDIDSVQTLLANGGKELINSQIYSKHEIEGSYPEFSGIYIYPLGVCDFTPLVYAKRYASPEVVELLIRNGARDGPAERETINHWIKCGPFDL